MRRTLAAAVTVAATALLAGCSGDAEPDAATPASTSVSTSPTPAPTDGSTPAPSASPTAPAYNPCDDLSAAFVSRALGAEVTQDVGNAVTPTCSFKPEVEGGPALQVNYLRSDLDFDQVWDSMGQTAGTVTDLQIATADNARMVVNATDEAVAVTGFVKTGDLIENVNGVALAPYDEAGLVRATRQILTRLSAAAAAPSS